MRRDDYLCDLDVDMAAAATRRIIPSDVLSAGSPLATAALASASRCLDGDKTMGGREREAKKNKNVGDSLYLVHKEQNCSVGTPPPA